MAMIVVHGDEGDEEEDSQSDSGGEDEEAGVAPNDHKPQSPCHTI